MAIASVNAQAKLTEQSKVSIYGIGPVSVGMTIAETSSAAGTPLIKTTSHGARLGCFYYEPQGGPEGVSFMAINGRIARVDVSNERITTVSGAKIGDTLDRIYSLYPGQIQITDITSGGRVRYFAFVPTSVEDKNYRLLFGMIQGSVRFFIAGQLPEVEYPEECL
ncbi:hypothetical protein IQ236_12630 [Planktothrix mougeotii LEGE 06226]|uniref:Uncharacterized protein n=2 Tax=Planktothrix mougeotii TaxID=54306 RepID=A0ABR9UC61_9CYAN|nr:hypothetical protein [Planktothrix mougeotii LEGE 06226]